MNLPKGLDLTSSNQKLFAGFLLVLVLVGLWYLVPPLVVLFANIWLLAMYGIPLLFLVYNYDTVWHWFKKASWELTKFSINKDKPGYLYKFHEFLLSKIKDMEERIQKLAATRHRIQNQLTETKGFIDNEQRLAQQALKQGKTAVVASSGTKIKLKQGLMDKLIPRYEFLVEQEKSLKEVLQLRTREAEDLKFSIDAKIEEYEILKEVDNAVKAAGASMDETTDQHKMYRESLRQMEDAVVTYTSNIEMFDTKMKPILERASVENAANEQAGLQLIEEYKKSMTVDFKQVAQISNK